MSRDREGGSVSREIGERKRRAFLFLGNGRLSTIYLERVGVFHVDGRGEREAENVGVPGAYRAENYK